VGQLTNSIHDLDLDSEGILPFCAQNLIHIDDVDINSSHTLYLYNISTFGKIHTSLGLDSNQTKSLFSNISDKVISYSKSIKNFYILIYFGFENELDKFHINKLYLDSIQYNIPRNKIIILSNNFGIEDNINRYKSKYKIKNSKDFLCIIYNLHMLYKGNELIDSQTVDLFLKEDDIISYKKNKLLFLNRRLHPHRILMLCLLAESNNIENNLISFDMNYTNTDYFIDYIKTHNYLGLDEYSEPNEIIKNIIKSNDMLKITKGYDILTKINKKSLDIENYESIEGRSLEVDDVSLYKDSYFSLVSETEFFTKWNIYTTEKTIKPIQQYHPFVILGNPNTLKYLQSMGFQTFSSVWDESYDNEIIDSVRIFKVSKLVNSLIKKTDDEWVDILKKIKPILIHNRELLKKYSANNNIFNIEQTIYKNLTDESIQNYQKLF